ncbi:MAG: APC family permease [Deltaproteobacteria bacterium]|nr:APC family permease [Deltaproteobacteria bacterium]MCL5792495.1 APC family permease [Deltaproteobacteria bacterium]
MQQELKKVLRIGTLISASVGIALASSDFPALVKSASQVGGWSIIFVVIIAGLVTGFVSLAFAELSGMYPTAAGVRVYTKKAFGDQLSLTITIFYVFFSIIIASAETYVFSAVLHYMDPNLSAKLWVLIFLVIAILMNIRGIEIAGSVENVLVVIKLAGIIGLSLYAIFLSPMFNISTVPFAPKGFDGFFTAVATAIFIYTGFEWTTPLAEEVASGQATLPYSLPISVAVITITFALFSYAMIGINRLSEITHTPIPHLIFGKTIAGEFGLYVMIFVSFLATLSTFNAGVMGNSRLIYALAREGSLPKFMSKLHSKYFTPWIALLIIFSIIAVFSVTIAFHPKAFLVPILVAASIETLMYGLISFSVISLRYREKDTPRVFKIRGGIILPLFTGVIFILLTLGILTTASGYVAILFFAGLLLSFLYSRFVVPSLQKR